MLIKDETMLKVIKSFFYIYINMGNKCCMKSFEHIDLFMNYKNFGAHFVIVYRPPPQRKTTSLQRFLSTDFLRIYEYTSNSFRFSSALENPMDTIMFKTRLKYIYAIFVYMYTHI